MNEKVKIISLQEILNALKLMPLRPEVVNSINFYFSQLGEADKIVYALTNLVAQSMKNSGTKKLSMTTEDIKKLEDQEIKLDASSEKEFSIELLSKFEALLKENQNGL